MLDISIDINKEKSDNNKESNKEKKTAFQIF